MKRVPRKDLMFVDKVSGKGLMFVDATLNGKLVKSMMIDTDTIRYFVSNVEARCLRLKLEKDVGRMKTVNSKALVIMGLVKQVHVKLTLENGLQIY